MPRSGDPVRRPHDRFPLQRGRSAARRLVRSWRAGKATTRSRGRDGPRSPHARRCCVLRSLPPALRSGKNTAYGRRAAGGVRRQRRWLTGGSAATPSCRARTFTGGLLPLRLGLGGRPSGRGSRPSPTSSFVCGVELTQQGLCERQSGTGVATPRTTWGGEPEIVRTIMSS